MAIVLNSFTEGGFDRSTWDHVSCLRQDLFGLMSNFR
jgi:hypothetical protein